MNTYEYNIKNSESIIPACLQLFLNIMHNALFSHKKRFYHDFRNKNFFLNSLLFSSNCQQEKPVCVLCYEPTGALLDRHRGPWCLGGCLRLREPRLLLLPQHWSDSFLQHITRPGEGQRALSFPLRSSKRISQTVKVKVDRGLTVPLQLNVARFSNGFCKCRKRRIPSNAEMWIGKGNRVSRYT